MDDAQLLRYNRHIMLPEIDVPGQQRLLEATVAIIGLGGLGSPAAMYLSASGTGRLVLVDFDSVETNNLQRQIIHQEQDAGIDKVESARQSIARLNSAVDVETISERLDERSMRTLCERVDLVLDGTDNFSTRMMINRACQATRTPLVSGAAIRFEGQLSVFDPRDTESPCYCCLYGDDETEVDTTCSANGVFSPLVGIIGSSMAAEAIKLLGGIGDNLTGRLLLLDSLTMQWREMKLKRDPGCPVCGAN